MDKNKKKMLNDGGRYSLKGSWLWGALALVLLLLVDQITKIWADVYYVDVVGVSCPGIEKENMFKIIPDVIEFGLGIEYNRGIAFSAFTDAGAGVKMAIVLSTGLIMAVLAVFYIKADKRRVWLRVALVLIVAGGLGNLIDRIMYKVWDPASEAVIRDGVRDMVYVKFIFNFGVCNFADFFICGGAVVLVLALLFFDTDAMFPMTKKYKALAKEAAEKEAQRLTKKTTENVADNTPTETEEKEE